MNILTFIPDWWVREPVRFGASLIVFVNSVIALAVGLGWLTIDATQLALIYLVVLNGMVVIFGEGIRSRVSPNGTDPVDPDGDVPAS